ncbi:MAG: iron ABC transporter permease [Desulfovibrionaceae bacterium]|nr:iron ABC transporter permease [Desulfovibrionaceae bacterium]
MSAPVADWRPRAVAAVLVLGLVLCLAVVLGLSVGSSHWSGRELLDLWLGRDADPVLLSIVLDLRLPRVLTAVLAGAALSLAGLVFQALLRNPLAEPYILGVSGGSAVGAILALLAGLARFPGVGLSAFAGGLGTLAVVLVLARGRWLFRTENLLLAGVMVNAFCSALILFFVSLAHDSRLQSILFWLMGDLSRPRADEALGLFLALAPCFGLIFWQAHRMNLLLLGPDTARSLGVRVAAVSCLLLVVTTFMVSATVCLCGLLGFVGLVVPHALRLVLGADHRVLVPASILGGGAFMVLCDALARTLPASGEMPVGVMTAMVGAPVFIYLLRRRAA